MSKKVLWIIVSTLTLALLGAASVFGVNHWKASQAESQAAAHRKQRAEMDAKIAVQDTATAAQFASDVHAQVPQFENTNVEEMVTYAKTLCLGLASGDSVEEAHTSLTNEDYDSLDAGKYINLSIKTYCSHQTPFDIEAESERRAELLADIEREDNERLRNEQSETGSPEWITEEKYLSAIRETVPTLKSASNKEILDAGADVCENLKLGLTPTQVVEAAVAADFGSEEAYLFVATSMGRFCTNYVEENSN